MNIEDLKEEDIVYSFKNNDYIEIVYIKDGRYYRYIKDHDEVFEEQLEGDICLELA